MTSISQKLRIGRRVREVISVVTGTTLRRADQGVKIAARFGCAADRHRTL
jgi:hypothetical protein